MAKISSYPAVTNLQDTDQFIIARESTTENFSMTVQELREKAFANSPSGTRSYIIGLDNSGRVVKFLETSLRDDLIQNSILTDGASVVWDMESKVVSTALLDTNRTALTLSIQNMSEGSFHSLFVRKQNADPLVISTASQIYKVGESNSGGSITLTGSANELFKIEFHKVAGSVGIAVNVESQGSEGTGVTDGDKGDITVSSAGTIWTIDNNAVTNSKILSVSWSKVTDRPTTLSGYGITDAQPSSANLTSLASLNYTTPAFVKMTAAGTFTLDTSGGTLTLQQVTSAGNQTNTPLILNSPDGTKSFEIKVLNNGNILFTGGNGFGLHCTGDIVAFSDGTGGGTGGGGSSGPGHVIARLLTPFAQREVLSFSSIFTVTDDAANNATLVGIDLSSISVLPSQITGLNLQAVTDGGNVTNDPIVLTNTAGTKQVSVSVDANGNILFNAGLNQNFHFTGDVIAFSGLTPPAANWWDSMPYATDTTVGGIKVGSGLTISNGVLSVTGGVSAIWGNITGTLSNQTDLWNALNAKANSSHTHGIGDITNLQSELDSKEPDILPGTTSQYWRGDKSWQTLNLQAVTDGGNTTNDPIVLTNTAGTKQVSVSVDANGNILFSAGLNQDFHFTGDVIAFSGLTPPAANWWESMPYATDTTVGGIKVGTGLSISNGLLSVTGGVSAIWGNITGTLSNQTDLWNALNGKATSVHAHVISDITGLQTALDGKEPTLTKGNLTESTSSVLTITGGTNAVIGTGTSIQVKQASGSQSGFLSSTDWTTFNNKQNALTNPVTGTGNSGHIAYWNTGSTITGESALFWDSANDRLDVTGTVRIVNGSNTVTVSVDANGNVIFTAGTNKNFHFSGDVVAFSSMTPPDVSWWSSLPYATASTVGGIKVGSGLAIDGSGVLSVTGAGVGSVTSVALSAPTGFSVSGSPVTSSGTLTLEFASGYSLPTTASQTNWDTAYGWGNHASAGYQVTSQKGVANGYASLDAGGKVPVSQLPSSLMEYKGVWNASTNSPSLIDGTGDTGDVYRVSVAGSQNLGSGSISFEVGDYVIYNGTTWEKSDTTDAVASVNGLTGVVVLSTSNISEGTNLYFTEARVRSTPLTGYVVGTNTTLSATDTVLGAFQKVQGQLNAKEQTIVAGTSTQYWRGDKTWQTLNTTAVAEGTNLYYTDTRVRAAALTGYTVGTNTALAAADTVLGAFQKVQGQLNAKEPTIVAGTSAQYWRGDKTWATLDTTAVVEGNNLYFTNARARSAISLTVTGSSGSATYTSSTGVFNIPTYTLAGLGGEPAITAGTTSQYWRGDKSWQTFNLQNLTSVGNSTNQGIVLTNTAATKSVTVSVDTNGNIIFNAGTDQNFHFSGDVIAFSSLTPPAANWWTSMPYATATTVGGIKVGANLSIDANGVLSATSGGGGSVTSVGLSLPSIFSVTGSPVTSSGTLTATLNNQSANLVFAGPTTGSASPTFRSLVASDIPALSYEPVISAGTTSQYWRGDKSWQTLNTTAVTEGTNLYFTEARVLSSVLTGYVVGTNTALAATDTVLAAFQKVQGQLNAKASSSHTHAISEITGLQAALDAKEPTITAGTTSQYWRGDKSWQTLNTTAVTEGTNLYFTEARVRSTPLTGYVVGTNTALAAADTILGAFQKVQGQLNAKASSSHTHAISEVTGLQTALDAKQSALNGTGFVRMSGTTVSYISGTSSQFVKADGSLDSSTYLTGNQSITISGDASGGGTTAISVTNTGLRGVALPALSASGGFLRYTGTGTNTWVFDTNTYLTGNQSITISGDASGSGTTSISLTLTNSGVSAGTYNNSSTAITPFTVDAKGRVTAVGSAVTITPAWSSITSKPTTISGFGITDAYTKTEVDSLLQGLDPKASVKAATTASVSLSGAQTIDGVSVVAGDRVLVKDQASAFDNGIYVVASGSWTRAADADSSSELISAFTFVEQGTINADTAWVCTNNGPISLGSTNITFVQFAGSGAYQARLNGTGFVRMSGTTLSYISGTSSQFIKADGSLDSSTYATTSSLGSYLPLAGGTMTGDITWTQTDRGLVWTMNTDGAYIKFFNTGDGDTNSRLEYATSDNGDEYHRFVIASIEKFSIKDDGARVSGNLVWHAGNLNNLNQLTNGPGYITSSGSITGSSGSVSGLTLTSSANGINPDSVTQNQLGYNTSVNLFGQTDGGLYSSAYSSSWIHQIYGDFRTGQVAIRGKNNGTWQGWRTVLDSGNYNSYSPTLTGIGASGTWSINVTGSAGSVPWSGVSSTPTTLSGYGITDALYQAVTGVLDVNATNSTGLYRGSTASWTNRPTVQHNGGALLQIETHPGGYYSQLFFDTGANRLYMRSADVGIWGSWATMLNSSNYTSYAPSTTGGGASGTWAISITGNSGTTSQTNFTSLAIGGNAVATQLWVQTLGYTSNTGTVTSVSGTGTVSGLTLTGTVTTSGSLTLGGTLSASIDNISDEHRLFNNMGDNHGTRTSFDATTPSYNFGWRYVQGSTNGPGVNSATQYYHLYVGLGNDYLATGAGSYGMQIAIPRNVTTPYIAIRYNENNSLASWQKISAGYADTSGNSATTSQTNFSSLSIGGVAVATQGWVQSQGYLTSYTETDTLQSVTTRGASTTVGLSLSGGLYVSGGTGILTSGTTSITSAFRVYRSGQGPASFGQYAGSWRSTIEVWGNASDRLLFLAPPDSGHGYSIIRSANGGMQLNVGGTTADQGTVGIQIETSGVVNLAVSGATVNNNTIWHTGNLSNLNQLTNGPGYTSNTGTVTSVNGTGTVSGLTLSGTVTTSGNITLGGTLSLTAANVNAVGAITNNTSGTAGSTSVLTASGALTTQQGSGTVIYSYALTNPQTGLFAASDNANSIITVNRHPGDYYSQLGFSSNGNLYYRNFVNTAINTSQAWQTIWTSSSLTNLNQLSNGPGYITSSSIGNGTLTLNVSGSGLSGSQSFTANQSGNATFTVTSNATTAATANTIAYRDANGDLTTRYFFGSYINTSDNDEAGITRFVIKNGDNYHRSVTTTTAADVIRGVASGSWGISVTGNAATVTNGMYLSGNQDISGVKTFYTPSGQTYNATSGNIGLTVFNPAAGDAMMTFHISNDYAGYFGLGGAENDLVWTGWSVGNVRYRILHSGNYNSYSPTLTGSGASGTWGINITGNSATTSQTTFSRVRTDGINRGSYGAISISGSTNTYSGIDFTDATATLMIRNSDQLCGLYKSDSTWVWYFDGNGILTVGSVPWTSINSRPTAVSAFTNDSGYITSSGSISGNAATATTATNWGTYGAVPVAGTSFGNANTIGRSDGNGYTYFNYINSNTSNSENPTISQVIVTNGTDSFYRKASIAHLTSAVQSNASGSWNISISGSAGSVANFITFNDGGAGFASGTSFSGSAARTISWNTIGALPKTRTTTLSVNGGTFTVDVSTAELFILHSFTAAVTFNAPTGTPYSGQKIMFRLRDNGSAKTVTFNTGANAFRASGDLSLPITTVANRTLYVGFIWNAEETRWDMLAKLDNFA